LIGCDWAVWPP
jgi:hypothetical protein